MVLKLHHKSLTFFFACLKLLEYIFTLSALSWLDAKMFLHLGRAIAEAVSRWLPTAAVRGSRPGCHVGFCGGQSGAGEGFL
jgi:hypothetical protein